MARTMNVSKRSDKSTKIIDATPACTTRQPQPQHQHQQHHRAMFTGRRKYYVVAGGIALVAMFVTTTLPFTRAFVVQLRRQQSNSRQQPAAVAPNPPAFVPAVAKTGTTGGSDSSSSSHRRNYANNIIHNSGGRRGSTTRVAASSDGSGDGGGEEAAQPTPTTFREAEILGLRLMQEGNYEGALEGACVQCVSDCWGVNVCVFGSISKRVRQSSLISLFYSLSSLPKRTAAPRQPPGRRPDKDAVGSVPRGGQRGWDGIQER